MGSIHRSNPAPIHHRRISDNGRILLTITIKKQLNKKSINPSLQSRLDGGLRSAGQTRSRRHGKVIFWADAPQIFPAQSPNICVKNKLKFKISVKKCIVYALLYWVLPYETCLAQGLAEADAMTQAFHAPMLLVYFLL